MKTNNKVAILPTGAALALTLIILLRVSEGQTTLPDNETTAGLGSSNSSVLNIADDEAEFVMYSSEITRRILAESLKIGNALNKDKASCDARVQSSCIGKASKFYTKRPCGYKEVCRS